MITSALEELGQPVDLQNPSELVSQEQEEACLNAKYHQRGAQRRNEADKADTSIAEGLVRVA